MQRVEQEFWRRAEVARLLGLAEAERRYFQEILATLPVAVAVAGRDGRVRAANRAFRELFGLSPEQAAHADVGRLMPGAPVAEWIGEVIDSGKPVSECELMTGEGGQARQFLLMLDPAPAWLGEQREEALLTVIELREQEEEGELEEEEDSGRAPVAAETTAAAAVQASAREVERAKRAAIERLSARVAHVANNLLMIIAGYGGEILESLPEGDVHRAGMAEILRAAERLGRITKDLNALAVAREYETAAFAVAGWMQAHMADWAEWGLDAEWPGPELRAQASPELLRQIVFEAARYLRPQLGEDARLRLRARAAGADRVQVRVEWAGAELGEEARERFFEPFAGEKVGADPPLGLAGLVKSWEKLGGTLALEEHALAIECPRAPGEARRAGALLLVEDEAGIRGLLGRALEREGFEVVQAGSAEEALEAWRERDAMPSALITDLTLPGASGRELADRLRMRWPEMPVLFITGYTEEQALAEAAACGGLDERTRFLHKPFTTARLVEEVKRLAGAAER